jgi:hypothetical protein
MIRRFLLPLLAALALSVGDAAAQLEFRGIAWGTSPDSTRAAIERAGYPFRGVDQDGDWVFGGPEPMDVVAMFDSAGLVYVEMQWMEEPDRLPARYERMADSMRRALGAPDSAHADEYERYVRWLRGGADLELFFRPRGGGLDTALTVRHYGPGWQAEDLRRSEAWTGEEESEADTIGYGEYHQAFGGFRTLIRVDTVRFTRLGPQRYLARFREDHMQSRRLPNGLRYGATVADVELDCQRMRTRAQRTFYLYNIRVLAHTEDVPEAERQWSQPVAGSPDEIAIRDACQVLARQP